MSVSGQVAPHGPGDQLLGEVLPHQLPRQQLLQLAAVSWPPARAAALHLGTGLLNIGIFSWVSPHLQARQLLDPLVERVARLPARMLGLAPGVAQPGAGVGLHPSQQQGPGEDGGDLGWQPHPASDLRDLDCNHRRTASGLRSAALPQLRLQTRTPAGTVLKTFILFCQN